MKSERNQSSQKDSDDPNVDPAAADAEAPPLSFEDLPDQAIGLILRSCRDPLDRLRLTQASPSARRLCLAGPRQEPGCLGRLVVNFPERKQGEEREGIKPISLSSKRVGNCLGKHLCLTITPWHPGCKASVLGTVRDWIKSRVRAFTDIDFTFESMWLDRASGLHVQDLALCTSAVSVLLPALQSFKGGLSLSVPLLEMRTLASWTHVLSTITFICPSASSRRLYVFKLRTDENNSTVSDAIKCICSKQQNNFTDLYITYCEGPLPSINCTLSSLVLVRSTNGLRFPYHARAVPPVSNLLSLAWDFYHPLTAPDLARPLSGSLQSLRYLCLNYNFPFEDLPPGTYIAPLSPLSSLVNLEYLSLAFSNLRISGPDPFSASIDLAFDAPLTLKGLRELRVELFISYVSDTVRAANATVALPFLNSIECPVLENFELFIEGELYTLSENGGRPHISFSIAAVAHFSSVHRLHFSLGISLLEAFLASFSLQSLDLSESFPHLEYFAFKGGAPPSFALSDSNATLAIRFAGFDDHADEEHDYGLEAILRPKVPRCDKVWLPGPLPRSFEEHYARKRSVVELEGVLSYHPHRCIYYPWVLG